MAQLFRPRSNTIARASLVGGMMLLSSVGFISWSLYHSDYSNRTNLHRVQPVPFSHLHHAGELGLDCRYCHASVETSADAGMPATETCMHCHSVMWQNSPTLAPVRDSFAHEQPLQWQRVNRVPDFVFFNHAMHISHGVGCSICHGRVDQMANVARSAPLTMRWCIDCHEQPEPYLRPREQVFAMAYPPSADGLSLGAQLVSAYHIDKSRLLDCDTCHR